MDKLSRKLFPAKWNYSPMLIFKRRCSLTTVVIMAWKGNYIPGKAGPRLNVKTVLFTYGDFHVKDKTAIRTSYL